MRCWLLATTRPADGGPGLLVSVPGGDRVQVRVAGLVLVDEPLPAGRCGYRITGHSAGVGSGRSGNHTEGDAWALVVPGAARPVTPGRTPRLEDVAATAAVLAAGDTAGLPGEPLLRH